MDERMDEQTNVADLQPENVMTVWWWRHNNHNNNNYHPNMSLWPGGKMFTEALCLSG